MGAEQSNNTSNRSNPQKSQMSEAEVKRLLEAQRLKYERKCEEMMAQAAKQSAAQAAAAQNSSPQAPNPSLERNRTPYQYTANDLHNFRESSMPQPLYPNLNQVAACSSTAGHNMNFQNNNSQPNLRPPQGFVFVNNYGQADRLRASPSAPTAPPAHSMPRERSVSRSRNNGNSEDDISCFTCRSQLGLTVYQCSQGHSACNACKISGRNCGLCGNNFTNIRNYALEELIAKKKVECPNKREGCRLYISIGDMDTHVRECPFKEQQCPLASVFGNCRWKGKLSALKEHFDSLHPNQRKTDVDTEMRLLNVCNNSQQVHLIVMGVYNFLFHLKVSETDRRVYMTAQLIGTKMSACKWSYEIHVYNKNENRRKYTFIDSCSSSSESLNDIFKEGRCAVLPLAYATTFINEGALTYKFFIKKNNEGFNKNQRGRDNLKEPKQNQTENRKCIERSQQREQSTRVFVNKKSK